MPCPYQIRLLHTCDRPINSHAPYMRSPHKPSDPVGARHHKFFVKISQFYRAVPRAGRDRQMHAITPGKVMPNTCDRSSTTGARRDLIFG
ncbi:MAG: hypothetical protein AB4352_11745 [Hormoscilla sp.]